MTDYYKELKLDRNCSCDELNEMLTELEAKWIRRETINPDEARVKLTYISEAKKVFKDESSRQAYDHSLESGNNRTASAGGNDDSEEQSREAYEWLNKANKYLQNKEYDLGVEAIEEAFERMRPAERSHDAYALAAEIYYQDGQYDTSLKYINKAITLNPNANYYNTKADIGMEKFMANGRRNENGLLSQIENALEDALELEKDGDKKDKSITYGQYARLYYTAGDNDTAKSYAQKAVTYGDASGFGQSVLDALQQRNDINTYGALVPTAFVAFFVVEILAIILVPASGGAAGIIMFILSLAATAFLNYATAAYPFSGKAMPWSIVLSCVFNLVVAILLVNQYGGVLGGISFVLYAVDIIVFCVMGHSRKNRILS